MTEAERGGRRWALWVGGIAAVLVLVALVVAVGVHTAPVRRYALRRAITTLEERAQLRVEAADLSYNLFAFRMTLRDVRVATLGTSGQPFLVAQRVSLALNGFGGFRFRGDEPVFQLQPEDRIDIEGGRVRIVRAADGRVNLPPSGEGTGASQPLQLGTISAPRLAFEFSDQAKRVAVVLPATDILLEGDNGRIELREPGRAVRGETSTTISELSGGLGFDGRSVSLTALTLGSDEAAFTVDGRLHVLADDPTVDVRVQGRGDIARLARWAELIDAPRGDLQVDGTVRGPFDALVMDVRGRVAALAWRDVLVSNITSGVRVTSDAVEVHQFDANLFGGRISATAILPLGTGDTRAAASWAEIDIAALMRSFAADVLPRPTGRATGALSARGTGADLSTWTIDARARTRGGRTAANRIALDGSVQLALEGGAWRLTANQHAGGVPVHAMLRGELDTTRFEGSPVNGTISVPPVAISALVDLLRRTNLAAVEMPQVEGTVNADVSISGSAGSPSFEARGAARVADVAPLVPDTPISGPMDVAFEATQHEVLVDGVLHDFNASAKGTVALRAPYDAAFDLSAPALDLARALRGIEMPVGVAGTAHVTADIAGPLDEPRRGRATLDVASIDATVGALPLRLAAPARVEYEHEAVRVTSLEVLAGDTRLSAAGELPLRRASVTGGAMLVTATGDLAQFTRAIGATGVVELPDVSGTGPAALLARITGSLEQPRVAADLELGPGTLRATDLPAATDVQIRAHADGEWVELRELRAEWQGSRVEASGRMPLDWVGLTDGGPAGAAATLNARLSSLTPQVLAPFVDADTLSQIEGSVDASLRLQGRAPDLASVTGDVQLDSLDVRVAELPVTQRVPTRIAIDRGFARVEAWEWTGQGGSLSLQGRVGLADQQAALLATGRFDLRMLTPFVRDAGMTTAGFIEPRLSITGVLSDPRVDGDLTVRAGEVRLADPRVIATGLNARAVVTRTAAQLIQLSGVVNGGKLSGSGRLAFAARSPLEATLAVNVDGMALEFPEGLRSELNAALGISLAVPAGDIVEPTGSVTGTVTVLRSAYREPLAVVTGLLAALRTRRLAGEMGTAEAALTDNLTLDVRVLTDEDILVDNNLGRLQVGTDVRIIGTVAAPSIAGRAELRQGGRLFFGRNIYVLESGTIDFANPSTIEPDVNIEARTRAGGEDIVLTVKGTPETLQTRLEAPETPELGEADLYSLLLTGRTLDEVTGEEGQIVGEQVLGYLSGDVLGLASRAVGLDTIRLGGVEQDVLRRDPTAAATEIDPTTRLTFGKSFGPDFDVTYSQSLRDGNAQAWILDYRPWRAVEARFVSDDENLRSYELRHDVSIGGASLSETAPTAEDRGRRRELRVTDLSVRGTGPIPEARVLSALSLETGDEFDFSEWQRDRERIEALYRRESYLEARIDSQRSEGAAGMTLAYEIAPGPRTRMVVTGHRIGPATIDRVETAWSEAVVDEFLVEEVRDIVSAELAHDGFLQAKVDASLRREPDEKVLAIAIDPGPRTESRVITIATRDEGLRDELTGVVRARRLEDSAVAAPGIVERELTTYLRSRGYLQARVRVGAPVFTGAGAEVRAEVEPGSVFTIADIAFLGAVRIPSDTLLAASELTPGMPFDPAAVEIARERIIAAYRRAGFARARVELRQIPRLELAGVAVTFSVDEGPRQIIAAIDVQGSRAVDADVVTRALQMKVDEPLASDAWLQARRRVFDTGLFRRVDVAADALGAVPDDAETQPMRVRVTVQPWPALRLRYGFQVAESRPEGEVDGRELVPGLSADLTRRTVFGRAVTLGAAVDYERREQAGRAFLSAPTMFGWPIESLAVVERSRETFTADTLTTDRSGVALEQRYRVVPNLRLSVTYRFERDHTFDTGEPDPIVGPRDITVRVARLNASAAYDTRDDPVDATRGTLMSSSFDYAPAALGSEFRFAKHLAQIYHFRSWRRLVFASAVRFGLAGALDDQLLLLSERFTAGGAHSVRGAEEDGLGPRDFFGPTGGEAVVVLNQEVRFPIYRWLRGVGFIDGGNVFAERSDLDLGRLVGSAGFGLRLETPFALLRVDYGRLFSPGPTDRSGRWYFGIGQNF